MVSTPVIAQVVSRPPAEPVWRAISADTIKMPEPIIDPTTIMVESKRPSPRIKPCSLAIGSLEAAEVAAGIFMLPAPGERLQRFRRCRTPAAPERPPLEIDVRA